MATRESRERARARRDRVLKAFVSNAMRAARTGGGANMLAEAGFNLDRPWNHPGNAALARATVLGRVKAVKERGFPWST